MREAHPRQYKTPKVSKGREPGIKQTIDLSLSNHKFSTKKGYSGPFTVGNFPIKKKVFLYRF
ncbi:unnamed protein product [marine sediment metagenome]|uniref:Uncharacterized protein n=1 Tax=marine sediment metagenome TaxID=412755 RepID=X1M7K5_9ZZZZ